MLPKRILLVEDDPDLLETIVETLTLAGHHVTAVSTISDAFARAKTVSFDGILSDVNLGSESAIDLVGALAETDHPPIVLMTAYAKVTDAVSAMRLGVCDYLVKPFDAATLLKIVDTYFLASVDDYVATDVKTEAIFSLARKVAKSSATVLVSGESGTGKEVLARYIHQHSKRHNKPFVAINCAAIPDTMLEATLFGYEKGAFTGANQTTQGKFELANHGTLLLDEISEMSVQLQAKLLRALQEKEIERLGSKHAVKVDVRIIATTNRNLKESVQKGEFREDLFYRLNVFPLEWIPLRERKEDIIPLCEFFVGQLKSANQKNITLSAQAKVELLKYHWPGNVRECQNVIQRAIILCQNNQIEVDDLMFQENESPATIQTTDSLSNTLEKTEYHTILEVLKEVGGSRKDAALKLGISPRTLRHKIAKMRDEGVELPVLRERGGFHGQN